MSNTAHPNPQDHNVTVNGRNLFAREWRPAATDKEKPSIILLHDSLGCVELWRDFPAGLCHATGRRVIAYDRLGFGQSDPYPGPIPLDFMSAESSVYLPVLLDALKVDTFVLYGHSVGGGMSVMGATAFPSRCAAVITQSAQAYAEDVTLNGVREARTTFANPAHFNRLKKYHGEKTPWVLSAWIDSWLSPAFANWSLEPWLRKLQCPVLALHGDNDEYGTRRHPDMIGALAGGPSQVEIIKDCGHVPHREQPEAVLKIVADFLR